MNVLMLVNVRDVHHCFINVKMLPNKEAQVCLELPVRAVGEERWGIWSHLRRRWW